MRIKALLITAGYALCLLTNGTCAQQRENVVREIQSASDVILSRSASTEDVHRSMIRLVETLSRIAEAQQFSTDCRKKIASALVPVRKDPLGYKARQALGEVYRSLRGKNFVFPPGVDSIDSAATYARERVNAGVKDAQEGHFEQAAEEILDFILTVATPMEQAH
jgi:predicted nucleic acid-binding protein